LISPTNCEIYECYRQFKCKLLQETCDPQHLDRDLTDAADTVAAAVGDDGGGDAPSQALDLEDIEIIDARDQETTVPPPGLFGGDDWTAGFGDDVPILVFEGLPSPGYAIF